MRVLFRKDVDGSSGDVYYEQYAGLSSETKPTMNIATGSEFFEVDTGKKYKFDELTNSWVEQPDLKSAINKLTPDATASDIGKALIVKTVANGKPSSYEYGEAGGGSVDPQDIANAVADWCEENITNPDSPPLDRSLSSSSSAVPADIGGQITKKMELVEVPHSTNLWDDVHKHDGWFHQNGSIYQYDGFYYWNIGAVSEGDVISDYYVTEGGYVDTGTMYAVVCLDSEGNTMPDVSATSVTTFTVPSGVSSITITKNNPVDSVMIVKNTAMPDEFLPYYDSYSCYVATPDFIRDAITSELILNVPAKVYAVVGVEFNIYFENITEEWEKYHWDVTCTKGKQMQRGYTITPVVGDVGTYSLTIRAYVDEHTYKEVTTTLVIASASSASGASLIVLGDSTTDNGVAVEKIHTDFEGMSTTVSTLGTRGTSPNNHEGRSGWTAADYLTVQSRDGVSNPFYNPVSHTFDASYYFTNSNIAEPDWFFINLGVNDLFGYVEDAELVIWIPRIIGHYDAMIQSLQTAKPNMKIGVCVTIPPNHSQDAFAKDYACGQTRDRCKRNNVIWGSKLIEHFKNKENEGIYIVPIHVNLDTVYNMGLESLPVNARNTSVTYNSPASNGAVHPVESGYWQIADVYTAFLKGNATS